jgi:hypothetical protein
MLRSLSLLFLVVSLVALLGACDSTLDTTGISDDAISDRFPTSATELAQLHSISFTGSIGESPMRCEISTASLSDGSLLINSGYAPLEFKRVTRDGGIMATHRTSIGAGSRYFQMCVTAPSPSGIVVITGDPIYRLWLVKADGTVTQGAALPEDFRPTVVRAMHSGGFNVVGENVSGHSVVMAVRPDLQVAWSTVVEGHTVKSVIESANGGSIVVGHAGRTGYSSEMAASLIVLGSGGELAATHEYTPRRWNLIHQIEPLAGGRFLLLGENQGGGHTHTWLAVVDGDGHLMWHNEEIWNEWEKASMPKRVLGVIEHEDGALTLLSADVRLSTAGSDQKTTVLKPDGTIRTQVDWAPIPGRPAGSAVFDGSSAFVVYSFQSGTGMSGYTSFQHTSKLFRLR